MARTVMNILNMNCTHEKSTRKKYHTRSNLSLNLTLHVMPRLVPLTANYMLDEAQILVCPSVNPT